MSTIQQLDYLDFALDKLLDAEHEHQLASSAKAAGLNEAREPPTPLPFPLGRLDAEGSVPSSSAGRIPSADLSAEAFISEIEHTNAEMEAKVRRELDRIERDRRVAATRKEESRALDEFLFLEQVAAHQTQILDEPEEESGIP